MTTARCIPKVTDLTRPMRQLEGEAPVRHLYHLFQNDPSMLGLPITLGGRFEGIVSRKWLFNFMSRPFCYDLYGKTPVKELLKAEGNRNVSFSTGLDINEALQLLLHEDPLLETDIIPVVEDDVCLGVVATSELMMAVSESQSLLLGELDRLSSRLREEVEKARLVQLDLLPEPEFECCGVKIGAAMKTSSEVGGDFYDYFTVGCDFLGIVVGDVSGHGVHAGMVTTAAKASLHTLIDQGIVTPAALLAGMNAAIIATTKKSLLMTCLIALIDMREGRCRIANAGHNYPYLYRQASNELVMLDDESGFPLGFDGNTDYREISYAVAPGDGLIIFTDGIVECENAGGDQYGYERLEERLHENVSLSPRELSVRLIEDAAVFTGRDSFDDDITIIAATVSSDAHRLGRLH